MSRLHAAHILRTGLTTAVMGATALVSGAPASASGDAVRVTTGADAGPGSFRSAVEAASADARIGRIVFDSNLVVDLSTSVVYAG